MTSHTTIGRFAHSALAMLAMLAIPAHRAAAQSATVAPMAWLAGCWEIRNGRRVIHEQWMSPLGGVMLGMSRTVVGDSLREYEHTMLQARQGQVYYVAKPSSQPQAEFAAVALSDTLAVFENKAHDFPQRIIYRRVGRDSLRASIEGPRGNTTREIVYPFARVRCNGA